MKVGVGARLSVEARAVNDPSVFTITEKAPTGASSWSKVPTSAFTLKTLSRHYVKEVQVDMKLGRRRRGHKG